MTQSYDNLKPLLDAHLSPIREEMGRLSGYYQSMARDVHTIEIGLTQRVTSLEGQLNGLGQRVSELARESDDRELVRQQSDTNLYNRVTTNENDDFKRWAEQSKKEEGLEKRIKDLETLVERTTANVSRLIWLVITSLVGLGVASVWGWLAK